MIWCSFLNILFITWWDTHSQGNWRDRRFHEKILMERQIRAPKGCFHLYCMLMIFYNTFQSGYRWNRKFEPWLKTGETLLSTPMEPGFNLILCLAFLIFSFLWNGVENVKLNTVSGANLIIMRVTPLIFSQHFRCPKTCACCQCKAWECANQKHATAEPPLQPIQD